MKKLSNGLSRANKIRKNVRNNKLSINLRGDNNYRPATYRKIHANLE
jgi:hypothetical protein